MTTRVVTVARSPHATLSAAAPNLAEDPREPITVPISFSIVSSRGDVTTATTTATATIEQLLDALIHLGYGQIIADTIAPRLALATVPIAPGAVVVESPDRLWIRVDFDDLHPWRLTAHGSDDHGSWLGDVFIAQKIAEGATVAFEGVEL